MRDHISLTNQIRRDIGGNLAPTVAILRWLDEHPDQVPGRTITESELKDLAARVGHLERVGDDSRALLGLLGITVAPDPEPTNADQIIDLMGMAPANLNRRELAKWLDSRGVKAPGGDDD